MAYSPVQAGFRSGYSTLTNVLTLHHLIEDRMAPHVVFLDFASAYDKVDWKFLDRELTDQGMNPLVRQLIYHLMYQDMSFSVVVNGCLSQPQARSHGLLQGSPLSPILFNRFVNSLLKSLNFAAIPRLPTALFFADDGVVMSPTARGAQSLLNTCQKWADNHAMSFNISKCGYLFTGKGNNHWILDDLYLNDKPVPQVTSYKYLGVMFDNSGIDFTSQADRLSSKVLKLIGGLSWHSDTWTPRIRYNIFKAVISPTLEYSLPLLFANYQGNRRSQSWKSIEDTYSRCINWIAGGRANRPHITCNLLGLLPCADRAQHLLSRFYLHLLSMDELNPLHSILLHYQWYPKSHTTQKIPRQSPLIYRFLNPPSCFTPFRAEISKCPPLPPALRADLTKELVKQKHKHILRLGPKPPKLLQIISLSKRIPDLDCDHVLQAPPHDQQRFLAWRRGVFGWGRKCPCGERFTRGHTKCMPHPRDLLTPNDNLLLAMDEMLLDYDVKYTVMDFLLNQGMWDKARKLLDFWQTTMANLLRPHGSPPRPPANSD